MNVDLSMAVGSLEAIHKNYFLRLVEWLLPISHFLTLLVCNALFAIVK